MESVLLLLGFLAQDFPPSPSFEGKQEYLEKQVLLKFKTISEVPHLNPEDSPAVSSGDSFT